VSPLLHMTTLTIGKAFKAALNLSLEYVGSSSGSEFQNVWLATGKARRPNVQRRHRGTSRRTLHTADCTVRPCKRWSTAEFGVRAQLTISLFLTHQSPVHSVPCWEDIRNFMLKKRHSIFKWEMSSFSHQRSLATELTTFYPWK